MNDIILEDISDAEYTRRKSNVANRKKKILGDDYLVRNLNCIKFLENIIKKKLGCNQKYDSQGLRTEKLITITSTKRIWSWLTHLNHA
ncbi:MAG: hypothetical protein KAG94_06775 [Clostridiales bacterium]|nr:hypothetical protein [Clostridiales bacterium]